MNSDELVKKESEELAENAGIKLYGTENEVMSNSKNKNVATEKDFPLDAIRADLVVQLETADDLDWDYFIETAERARQAAIHEGRNMSALGH